MLRSLYSLTLSWNKLADRRGEWQARCRPVLFVAALSVLLLSSCADRGERFQRGSPVARVVATIAPVATLAEFNRVEIGMTRSQVTAIIGDPGEVTAESEIADIVTISVHWINGDGGNMIVMFQNGKVISKAQFGLR